MMPGSDIIVLSDILKKDLFTHDTIEDVVTELQDIAANVNRSRLFYAWMVGNFVNKPAQLRDKYGIQSIREFAKLLGTTEMTVSRWRSVAKYLTAPQVVKLGQMQISINAVLKIVEIGKSHELDAKGLLEDIIDNGVRVTQDEISQQFMTKLLHPTNIFPGGEVSLEEGQSKLQQEIDEMIQEQMTPADRLLESTEGINPFADVEDDGSDDEAHVSAPQSLFDAAGDAGEDDDYGDTIVSDSSTSSLNKRDAEAMIKQLRPIATAAKRDCVTVTRDLEAQIQRLLDSQSVVLGDTESSDQFDEMMHELYAAASDALLTLCRVTAQAAGYGYLNRQLELPDEAVEAFNGTGLFTQD